MIFDQLFQSFFKDIFEITRMVESEIDGITRPGKPTVIGNIKGQFDFLSASDMDSIPNPALTANAIAFMKLDSDIKQKDIVKFDNNKYIVLFVDKLPTHLEVYLKLETENFNK